MNERFFFLGGVGIYVCSLGENEKVYCNTFSLNRLNCHLLPHTFLFSQDNCFKNQGICQDLLYLPVLRPTLGIMMFWSRRMGRVKRELQLWWQVNAVWDPALLLISWDHSNVTWQPEPQFYIFSKKIIILFIFGCAGLLGAGVRHSAHGKGHEEGGLTYAKVGLSLRSPPGNPRASTPITRACLLYYFVLLPTPLTLRGAVPHHLFRKRS